MATSERKIKATVSKKSTAVKKVKPEAKTPTEKKAQVSAADIINQFSQLPAADRVKLHRDLQGAIERDTNLSSSGKEADGAAYQELINKMNNA